MQFNERQLIVEQTKKPKKISGTKFASILGKNPYNTEFATWCDITHAYDFPFESTIFTEAGKAIEPLQATYVSKYFKGVTTPTDIYGEDYFSKTYGNFFTDEIFGGMWDYLEIDDDGVVQSVFEMKTTGAKKRDDWTKDIPEYYALQAALYAYLLGIEQVHMVASFLERSDYFHASNYIPTADNTIIIDFKLHERYPNFEQDYIQPAKDWWDKYVVTGVSPEYSQSDLELVEDIKKKMSEATITEPSTEFTVDTLSTPTVPIINNIESEKVQMVTKVLSEVDEEVSYFNSVSDTVVNRYTASLDDIMTNIKRDVIDTSNPSLDTLEKYLLELTNALYFVGEQVEQVGVYDDVSKAHAKEAYNNAYLESQSTLTNNKKPTVGESTAVAEGKSLYHSTVNSIYSRSYKTFKFKLDAAYEMIRSISKIISKRLSEQSTLPESNGGRTILNENYTI